MWEIALEAYFIENRADDFTNYINNSDKDDFWF